MDNYKKIGFRLPKDYFNNSKKEILAKVKVKKSVKKIELSYYSYSLAAILAGVLLYYNLIDVITVYDEINLESPLLSSIISGQEITDDVIIEFYSESLVLNEFQIPK